MSGLRMESRYGDENGTGNTPRLARGRNRRQKAGKELPVKEKKRSAHPN